MIDGDDDFRPLSESCVWELQRHWFDEQGIRAWSDAVVPQYVTSNPWIASSYAHVAAAWMRDCIASFDPGAPVEIVELGCGSGRFGYLFLRRLLELLPAGPRVRYVFTDFTDYNLDVLRSHPSLQPFVDAGQADFARFDVESDRELRLTHSGDVLAAGGARNPMVFIANYVFDGVRNDCFRVAGGIVREVLVRAARRESPGEDGVMDGLAVACSLRPAADAHYEDPLWNRILDSYRQILRGDSALLFPCGALNCLRNLRELSDGRLLLLSGDKGYVHEETLERSSEPQMSSHGSFSMMVNYHAVGQWVAASGGRFLSTSHLRSPLSVVAVTFGETRGSEMEPAFRDWLERRGPDDFLNLKKAAEQGYESFTLEQLLAWIRFSGWDHNIFLGMFTELLRKAETAPDSERNELAAATRNVWRESFPLREPIDLAFHAGVMLMAIGSNEDALAMFEESIRWYGPDGATSMNMAVCCCAMQQWSPAAERAREALELDPELETARTLLAQIEQVTSAERG